MHILIDEEDDDDIDRMMMIMTLMTMMMMSMMMVPTMVMTSTAPNQLLVSCVVRLMCGCSQDNDSLRTRSIRTVLAVSRERLSARQCGLFLHKERHCSVAD